MAYAGTIENRIHDSFSRAGQAALSGPGTAAVLLGAVVFVNEANFRLGSMHQVSFDWQIVLRLLICAACGLYGLVHLRQTMDALTRFPGAWALLFVAWSLITIPMAINPPFAVATVGCLACVVIFAPAALMQLGGRRVVETVVAALSIYMVLSWIVYFALPTLGRTEYVLPNLDVVLRFGGLNHSNTTGRLAALGIGMVLLLGCQRVAPWRSLYLYLFGFAVSLYFTDSRTTLAAGAAVVLLFIFRFGSAQVRGLLVAAVPVVAILIGFGMVTGIADPDALMAKISRTGDSQEMYSLTGRVGVWEAVMEGISDSPIYGYGHGCARFVMAAYNEALGQDVAGYHAHNLLLNVVLSSGFIGGALLLLMLASQLIGFFRQPDIFPDVILVLTVVCGISDAVMLNPVPDSYTLLWLIALCWRQMGATVVAEPESPRAVGVVA